MEGTDGFAVAGRGVLHLSVLIETMRREGYEFSVGKPRVIYRLVGGVRHEPFETLNVEVPAEYLGRIMELVGHRRGKLEHMQPRGDYTCTTFRIPARGLDRAAHPSLERDAGHGAAPPPLCRLRSWWKVNCRGAPMASWCPT